MKTLLRFYTLAFIMFLLPGQLRAQCDITNLAIELRSAVPVNDSCRVIFNYSFNQDVNNGNKNTFIHLWNTAQYPDLLGNGLAYTNSSDHPDPVDLVNALATIVINNSNGELVIGSVYLPHPVVPVLTTGLAITVIPVNAHVERITISNITLTVPNCSGSSITGDTWSSQATNGNAHCVKTGVTIVVGNPRVEGLLYCTLPRQYNISIGNLATTAINIQYNIYVDEGDGVYEPLSHDTKTNTTPFGPFTIIGGGTYQSGMQSYLPYANTKPYTDMGLWVEVITEDIPNKTIYFINNFCIPLPVSFISFTARRQGDMITLTWETATETDNSGFEIERKIGTGKWEVIDFIMSKAPGGNSDGKLTYVYNDNNPVTSITEYRIKQIDFDRTASYSIVNAVKGIEFRTGILVYPNPSTNGQVQIVMDDWNSHTIYIYDAAGRRVREWNNWTNNNLTVDGLYPGYYLLKVVDRVTGKSGNKKFIIMQ